MSRLSNCSRLNQSKAENQRTATSRNKMLRASFVFAALTTCFCHLTVRGVHLMPVARKTLLITSLGPQEKVFKVGETVSLPCMAKGAEAPTYRWTKDERDLDERQLSPGAVDGTLTLEVATETDQGVYQCYASNKYGVAATVKTVLRMAVLDPFPSVREPKVHRIQVGRPLTLHCSQPFSFPAASVYWSENRKKETELKAIETNERISLDCKGNLHFANVLPEDHRAGQTYVCVVFNSELRSLVEGDDQKIDPQRSAGFPRHEPPRLVFSSPIPEVAIKGQTKNLICIFSGFPTPKVTWKRLDAKMSDRVEPSTHGQELVISGAEFEDAGRYQCEGTNAVTSSSKDIILAVESPPYWRNGRSPDDVIASEEDDVTVACQVNGVPKPNITWFINGVPVENVSKHPRRSVAADVFRIENVTDSDTQVIQCNASNTHGYLFANVFISVLAESPSFVSQPQTETRLSVGQSVVLSCRAIGAPKPTVEWTRGRRPDEVILTTDPSGVVVDNGRFEILENGDLSIRNAQRDDEDTFYCRIRNKFGSDVSSGVLLVRERTTIMDGSEDHLVVAGSERVVFRCNASTDPAEKDRLKIEWSKDGKVIPGGDDDQKFSVEDGGRRLVIKNVQVTDFGSYTCRASNGLDLTSHTAKLTVKGAPDPPRMVRLSSCSSKAAEVTWSAGNDNNDPITGYIVYLNTSDDEAGKYEEGARVNASARHSARVQLRPWANYTFHVVAENGVGVSGKSETTQTLCTTPPARPYRNPQRVCTDSKNPSQLVIVWEPMLRTEHNGPGFHYVVTYRSLGTELTGMEVRQPVLDWRQSELVIDAQQTFEEFEISVQAANSIGTAHGTLDRMIGYSGEDVPVDRPKNFHLIDESLNDTSAAFVWDAVNEDRKTIRGFFQGYQIRFWKSVDPLNVRTEDVIVHPWSPCRSVKDRPKHGSANDHHRSVHKRISPATIEALTTKLWPFSTITAGVSVISGTKQGQPSDAIEFTTPEGVPDVVPAFWVSERGSHHLRLSWSAPFEVNGILKGYGISYKEAPPAIDTWKGMYSTYPDLTYRKIRDLKSDTVYVITIWAETNAGRGQEMTIEETTVSEDVPDQPTIDSLESGYDYVNVSWLPSGDEAPRSPGSDFVVEYKYMGSDEWKQSAKESEHNWLNLTNLEHGELYEFRVIALNRRGDAMKSDIKSTRVGLKHEAMIQKAGSYGWVAAFVCILVLLGTGLAVFIVIKRNRGGMYPVYKKEKLRGNEKRLDKEPAFGEYVRTEDSTPKTKSQGSLESSSGQSQEEATDSLGIYDDGSSSKFNEDGSIPADRPEVKIDPPQQE